MRYKLINVGRAKVNRIVECKNQTQLAQEVGKHLMSKDVELQTHDDGRNYDVVVGGFRNVGSIQRLPSLELVTNNAA